MIQNEQYKGIVMKMKPLGDRVLLKEREKVEKSVSGIMLMNDMEGDYVYADVVAVGNGLFTQTGDTIPMTVKEGDEVMIHKTETSSRIKIDDEEYLLVRESEIAMVNNK
jgi:chaperonin GroES